MGGAETGRVRGPVELATAIVLGGGLVVAVLAIFLSSHLPSDLAIRVSQIMAVIAAAAAGWGARPGGLFDPTRTGQKHWLTKSVILRAPLMMLFVFFTTFTAVEDGVLAVATAVIGSPDSRTLTVTGVSHPRKQCDHFDVQEVGWLLGRALCGAESDLKRARPGDALVVFGRSSLFGLNVERYELHPGEGVDIPPPQH